MAEPHTLSPLDYGIENAESGIERYEIIRQCHEDAIKNNLPVSYAGIDSIFIEIPQAAKSIPLPSITDFAGTTIVIKNRQKDFNIFKRYGNFSPIEVSASEIDKAYFKYNHELRRGRKLLLLQDENPWLNKRIGYNSDAVYKRKDILILKNGRALNKTIIPYDNPQTKLKAWVSNVSRSKTVIKNLNIIRSPESTYITYIFGFRFLYNLTLDNITIVTPEPTIESGDFCMYFEDCARITINNLLIENTYSSKNMTGYGVRLLNVYDVRINKMRSHSNWGVFGNCNVNKVTLKGCDINRFDVHYYGKDIKSVNCIYRDLYNQFASVYGEVSFKKCEFVNTIPVLFESSFNAYTPFDLICKNCTFHLTRRNNYLITLFSVPEEYNERLELKRKCLPNIAVKDCKFVLADDVKDWYVVWTGGVKYQDTFDYITDINIKGLVVENSIGKNFKLLSEDLRMTNTVKTTIKLK